MCLEVLRLNVAYSLYTLEADIIIQIVIESIACLIRVLVRTDYRIAKIEQDIEPSRHI